MRHRPRLRLAAALLVVAVASGGCGGSDEEPAAPTGATVPVGAATSTSVPGVESSEPVLSESADDLGSALSCTSGVGSEAQPAVLLVHGTGVNAADTWDHTLLGALVEEGHATCTVQLPAAAMNDIQRSAQYVVAALRTLADSGYRQITVVGHSQGVLVARWAITWWPVSSALVTDLIGLAGPNQGTPAAATMCGEGCAPALHQMSPGSNLLTTLDAAWADIEAPATTTISSRLDEVVPFESAAIEGAANIVLQDICEANESSHVELITDATVLALILDALANDGPADPERLAPDTCERPLVGDGSFDPEAYNAEAFEAILGAGAVPEEPDLAGYARAG